MKKLRVGFLVDSSCVNYYVYDLIKYIDNNDLFHDPIIITDYKDTKNNKLLKGNIFKLFEKTFQSLLYRLIRSIEYGPATKKFPNYGKLIDLKSDNDFKVVSVEGARSKSGIYLDFTFEDIEKIKDLGLDCIIRCGTGIIKGKILEIPAFGILSFHHGDNRVNRGGPSGFWEVLDNTPTSGFIIQKLTNELDGGDVLFRGNLMSRGYWLSNSAQLLEKSNYFLKKILEYVAKNRKLPSKEGPRLHDNKLYKIESSLTLLRYFGVVSIPKIYMNLVSKVLGPKVARWSVGFANHNDFKKSLWRYSEIKNPKGRFLADPFVFTYKSSNYIFVEDLFFSDNKGRISVVKLNGNDYEFLGVVLEENFHLSFPYVFESDGEIFMIPETHDAKDIRLYKCYKFPMVWKLEKVLMKNIYAADTIMINNHNKWFMLTNICSAGFGEFQSELHIFWSDELRSNNWKPIKNQNPVIFDSLSARNGGAFYFNDKLYRVNQIHGKEHYGKSFGVNEVIQLSESGFEERRVSTVNPNFKKGIVSTHHFSANEKVAAIDFCRLQRLNKVKGELKA